MAGFDKQRFDEFYRFKAEKFGHPGGLDFRPGIFLHYHYHSVGQYQENRFAPKLAETLDLKSGESVVIIGCGFNWTGAGLAKIGIDVSGTEISAFCLAEKDETEEAEIRQCCLDAGVDPDRDLINWRPESPLASLVVPTWKWRGFNHWLVADEESKSRAQWRANKTWRSLTEAQQNAFRDKFFDQLVDGIEVGYDASEDDWLGWWRLQPESQAADLPSEPQAEWMANPLDVFLRGGRINPMKRASAPILAEDIQTQSSRRRVIRSLAGRPRFIISEEVLNSVDDMAALDLCEDMARLAAGDGATVIHMISPKQLEGRQSPDLNWKLYSEWRAFLDNDNFTNQLILPTVTSGGVEAYIGLI